MNEIRDRINAVRRRQQWQWVWQSASAGLLLTGLVACVLSLAGFLAGADRSQILIPAIIAAGPVAGWAFAALRACGERDAARTIDRVCRLRDRTITALCFSQASVDQSDWQQLQLEDARRHLAEVQPEAVVPVRMPRTWIWGMLVSIVAIAFGVPGTTTDVVIAEDVISEVVATQADRLQEGLRELQAFETQDADPQMKELIRELSQRLEELRQPGVAPREAFAGLSEMEAALREKQEQLASPDITEELADIGRALSLSEELRSVGETLAERRLDQAAEQLAAAQMPDLDRQTATAITEELRRIRQQEHSRASDRLKQATSRTEESLRQGDREQFREAMRELSDEAAKQARRSELSQLLNKQSLRLAESKSEFEAESGRLADGNRRGSRNWGRNQSDNLPGTETERQTSDSQMKITGRDSGEGDADTETVQVPEAVQEAVRRYREQSGDYERLSESVLEQEPIPLGQRQTIRRYFELIRPSSEESDAAADSVDP